MPFCKVNCCLCGAPIDETQPWPPWMASFRAVCAIDERWNSALISRVGERQQFADVIPDPLHADAMSDGNMTESPDHELMEIDISSTRFGDSLAVGPGPRVRGFPFHCPCWDLFVAARNTSGGTSHDVQALFEVLMSFPRHNLVELGHNYGDVAGYDLEVDVFEVIEPAHQLGRLLPGEEPRLVYDRTDTALLDMQKQDPMHIVEIRSILENGLESIRPPLRSYSAVPEHATEADEPFRKLPVELLQFFVAELSTPDVIALRQSSRSFQRLELPDTFWRSRFLAGRELEHVFEAGEHFHDRNGQWRTIYRSLKAIDRTPPLTNRRRVWHLAGYLSELLDLRVDSRTCVGTKVRSYFEPGEEAQDNGMAWIRGQRCCRAFNQIFHTGCRVLFERTVSSPAALSAIYVSTVNILGKAYVSGLRLEAPTGKSERIGYVRPGQETLLTWDVQIESYQILGFELALDQHGVRGLRAMSTAEDLSAWAGQHDDIPKRRLVVHSGGQSCLGVIDRIKGGFDALKLVSLSLPSSMNPVIDSTPKTPPLRDLALWFPEIPASDLSFSGITMNDLQTDDVGQHERPISMLMFEQKKPVTRLTTLTQEGHAVMGLKVTFEGNESIFLGSDEPCRPSMQLSAPSMLLKTEMSFDVSAGEKIIALDVLQGHYVLAIKVYTNRGRAVELPPPKDDGWDMEARAEDEGEIKSVKQGLENVVGFLARAGSKGIQNLGLVHI